MQAELVILNHLEGIPLAWRCSACGKPILMPDDHSVYITTREITAEFRKHCEADHLLGS